MKKILGIALVMLGFLVACDDCKDTNCMNGGACADGGCICVDGYEGDNCETATNAKYLGDYDVDYTGTGAFAGTNGTTVAMITEGENAGKILIDVVLDLNANALGQNIALPLEVSVQGDVDGNRYYVPLTTINAEVMGLAVEITFEVEGTLDGESLDTELDVSGFLTGKVLMEGTRQ